MVRHLRLGVDPVSGPVVRWLRGRACSTPMEHAATWGTPCTTMVWTGSLSCGEHGIGVGLRGESEMESKLVGKQQVAVVAVLVAGLLVAAPALGVRLCQCGQGDDGGDETTYTLPLHVATSAEEATLDTQTDLENTTIGLDGHDTVLDTVEETTRVDTGVLVTDVEQAGELEARLQTGTPQVYVMNGSAVVGENATEPECKGYTTYESVYSYYNSSLDPAHPEADVDIRVDYYVMWNEDEDRRSKLRHKWDNTTGNPVAAAGEHTWDLEDPDWYNMTYKFKIDSELREETRWFKITDDGSVNC